MTKKAALQLLGSAASKWNAHNAPRLAASLAYYSLLSMAPLLILVIGICSLVLTKATAEQDLVAQVQRLTGPIGARTVVMLIENSHRMGSGIFAAIAAIVTLLFGASGVFVELRDSLNTIWEAKPKSSGTWRDMVWQRLVSFGLVLALGFLLLVSLVLSTTLAVVGNFFQSMLPLHLTLITELANFLVSLAAIAGLFAFIFKFVPDVPISWSDVSVGAIVTAALFTIGKGLLGLYLGTAGVGSTYGAAGSVVALVVWVYYSAQIFFFGAIITRVYADNFGSRVRRNRKVPDAVRANAHAAAL